MKPIKVSTTFRAYLPRRPERKNLMSYPDDHNLVHFGSPEGTQYKKEDTE